MLLSSVLVIDVAPGAAFIGDAFDVDQVKGGDVVRGDRAGPGAGAEHEAGLEIGGVAHAAHNGGRVHEDTAGGDAAEARDRFWIVAVDDRRMAPATELGDAFGKIDAFGLVARLIEGKHRVQLLCGERGVSADIRLVDDQAAGLWCHREASGFGKDRRRLPDEIAVDRPTVGKDDTGQAIRFCGCTKVTAGKPKLMPEVTGDSTVRDHGLLRDAGGAVVKGLGGDDLLGDLVEFASH